MSGFITQATSNDSLFFNPTFFSSLNLDSRFRNIANGTATASKALFLDENSSISGINNIGASTLTLGGQLQISDTINSIRTSSGNIIRSINGTSSIDMYHFNNGSFVMETITPYNFRIQTNNLIRLTIDSGGAVSIGGSLSSGSLMITPSTVSIGGNSVSGCVYHTSSDRNYGQRYINTNTYSLLSLSAGGNYIDSIIYNHSVAPSNLPLVFFNASIAATNNIACGGSFSCGGSLSTFNGAVEILGFQSITVSGQRGLLQASTQSFRSDTISSVAVGLRAFGWIWSDTGIISSSDKRLKTSIEEVSLEKAKRLLNIKPISFVSKSDQSKTRQVGILAQDLIRNNLDDITTIQPNESVEKLIEADFISPAGYSWSVSYDRVGVYLLKIVQEQQKQIEDLNDQIKHLTTIIYSNIRHDENN